ncbi:hypothetical protein A2159_00655 [Candidatus Woesebacteria bacterium RBG_13_34_9]|uniref:Uncharacterized protein n=1 Tax=Candidatus Woesebacteria bacterium RBG_13_34_9 TaxID=1802477 RepID=A0A1F7X2W0_9BACT|nr:MAG: hypothetical protein A2159_00655 [Candidatus Woesebacteria bacterium RBG_13_34_9]
MKKSKYIVFGDLLKSFRTSKKIGGLKRAASILSINYTYLHKIENGKTFPSHNLISDVVEKYKLDKNEVRQLNRSIFQIFSKNTIREGVKFDMIDKSDKKEESPQKNISEGEFKINMDPIRNPVLYCDSVFIKTDNNGVVLDFAQQVGPTKEFNIVARVGISKNHAETFIAKMRNVLNKQEGTGISETGKAKIIN